MKMDKEHRNTTKSKRKKEWIPVSKKLPKEGVKVLVWYEYFRYGSYNRLFQTYGLGYVYRGEFAPFINGESGWQQLRVIAWMPLPEKYKEGE
jgi:hypothetical protein|nr:MAG TPA: Protein of unknown function (DUF551) [Caudoviricetes sp.]